MTRHLVHGLPWELSWNLNENYGVQTGLRIVKHTPWLGLVIRSQDLLVTADQARAEMTITFHAYSKSQDHASEPFEASHRHQHSMRPVRMCAPEASDWRYR